MPDRIDVKKTTSTPCATKGSYSSLSLLIPGRSTGHAHGAGWLVDAAFDFEGGVATPDPFAVVPLWAPKRVVYGDPTRPIDVTANIELTSGRWHDTRARHKEALIQIEGEERFDGLQRFATAVYNLTNERRLSRFVFVAEK